MRALYLETLPEYQRESAKWDLSVSTIRESICAMSEDDPKMEDISARLQQLVDKVSFEPPLPKANLHTQLYQIGFVFPFLSLLG